MYEKIHGFREFFSLVSEMDTAGFRVSKSE